MIKETFLDFLFPRRCPVCGEITSPAGSLICPSCFLKLSFVKPPVCKKCGKEIMDETMEYCSDCMGHFHAFESGVALLNYDETARTVMAQIKYKNKREYLDFFGAAMAKRYGMAVARMASSPSRSIFRGEGPGALTRRRCWLGFWGKNLKFQLLPRCSYAGKGHDRKRSCQLRSGLRICQGHLRPEREAGE